MRRARAILAAMAIVAASFASASAEEQYSGSQSQRPCLEKDIAGAYVVVTFHETPEGGEQRLLRGFPHQYIGFYPDHAYADVITGQKFDTPAKLNSHLHPRVQGSYKKYAVSGPGALDLYINDTLKQNYSCIAHLVDDGDYKKGDLELTGYSKSDKAEIYKLYRHWY